MKKRLVLFICALLCVQSVVFAIDIDSLVDGAVANSVSIEKLGITKENSLASSQLADLEDETKVSVSSGTVLLQKDSLSMSPSVNVSLGGLDDDLSVDFGVANQTSIGFGNELKSSTVTPSASVSKTFDLSSFVDERDSITKTINALQRELNYSKGVLEFENGVINDVISIIQTTISIETSQRDLERRQKNYESDIALGVINEGSLSDMKTQMELSKLSTSLENYKTQLETAKHSFYNDYGIAYEDVDSVREAVLDVVSSSDGNTNVMISKLNLDKAQQELDAKTGGAGETLRLSSSLETPVTFSSGTDAKASVSGNVGAEISGSNYRVSATANAKYDGSFSPSLTIQGTWSNRTDKKATDLEILTLENDLIVAQMNYDSAKQSYDDTVRSLSIEVQDFKATIEAFEVEAQYNQRILEYTTTLYEKGMASESELSDAKAAVAKDDANRIVYALQALVLENRIKINEL